MFKRKNNLALVMTVFDTDALRISLPPLHRLERFCTLVIYNDNPNQIINRRTIRRMGWHGVLHIINSDKNTGEFESRFNAVKEMRKLKIACDWVMFIDQDDVLLDACVPAVSENIFAVVQNATVLNDNITDMFKITPNWANGTECGKTRPNFEITGTIIRRTVLDEFTDLMVDILPKLYRDLRHTRYRVPIAQLMWLSLKEFMQVRHPEMMPIYMNRTNYVAIKMGHAAVKYGRRTPMGKTAQVAISETIKKFLKTVNASAKIVA
jgi:hypothetical protein